MTESRPSTAEVPILSLSDVHAYVGQSHILDGVDFDVRSSAVTVMIGRNGVGKTSTLRSVLGLMSHKGRIEFKGQDISTWPTHEIIRLGIGYVPEDRDVFHGLTVAENLRLAERRDVRPDYDRVYELFPEMRDRRAQRAGTMSGGQQQMLSLSRALLNDNELLLIDEPTKGLAPRLVSEFVEALERIVQTTSVLLVEQNLAAARRLADWVVVLSEGTVVLSGSNEEILTDEESIKGLLGVGSSTHVKGATA